MNDKDFMNTITHEDSSNKKALERACEIWRKASQDLVKAEASLRLLIQPESKPSFASIPHWAASQLAELSESQEEILQSVLNRTSLILAGAAEAGLLDGVTADIGASRLGRLEIEFQGLSAPLTWIVEPCELPWPCVHVKVYTCAKCSISHAILSAVCNLGEEGGNLYDIQAEMGKLISLRFCLLDELLQHFKSMRNF